MAVEITPKNNRKPLKINYGGTKYTLPGRIPTDLITAQDSVPRPKVMAGSQKDAYQGQVSVAIIAAFIEHVVPEDFKNELDFDDVPQVFEAWSEHVGWGKASSSGNSTGRTKPSSSTKQFEEDSD